MRKLSFIAYRRSLAFAWFLSVYCGFTSHSMSQSVILKSDNGDNLDLPTSWTGSVVPGALDTAVWDSTVTGANAVSLGSNLSWRGLRLTNPGGAVTVNAGNVLTLGTGGIDMSAATQNLTISAGLTLSGGQSWNVAAGRALTLNTGTFTRGAGSTLSIQGGGTVAASMAGITNVNGILGPWATVGTGASTSFATLSGGSIVGATGTAASGAGLPNPGSVTTNYDITTASTTTYGAASRQGNTFRLTVGATALTFGNSGTQIHLLTNGIMNSGTGLLTITNGGTNANSGIQVGSSQELVVNAANNSIVLGRIVNNGAVTGGSSGTASSVTVAGQGPNTVTLNGANLYTGATNVSSGTLIVGGAGSINSSSGISVNGGKYLHTSSVASTRALTLSSGTVDGTGTIGAVTVADNAANIVANGNLTGTGTLTASSLAFGGDATMNLRLASGAGVVVTGALSTTPGSGTVTVNATKSGWTLGNNNLISFGSFGGSATDFTLGSVAGLGGRQAANGLLLDGNNVALSVIGDLPVWTGVNGSSWTTAAVNDNSGLNNWATKTGQTGTNFWAADTPEFNDTYNVGAGNVAVTNRAIDIQGADVTPGLVSFNNSLGDYTLSSSTGNGIIGGAGLVKSGSSALIIANSNSFTGATTINAGTLQLGNGVTDGSIGSSSITNNGSLVYNNNADQTYAHSVTGTGTITKNGLGSLTLSTATASSNGGTSVNSGRLIATANFLSGGAVSVASGATLTFTGGNQTFSNALSGSGAVLNDTANTIIFTGDHSAFNGTFNHTSAPNNIQFNSGSSSSANAAYTLTAGELIFAGAGDYTVKMGSLSSLAGNIRGGNAASGTTTLEVGNLNTDTSISGGINSGTIGVGKVIAINKVGTGTLTLNGTNAYTGTTDVTSGTLAVVGNKTGAGAVFVTSGATLKLGTNVADGNVAGPVAMNGTLSGRGTLSGGVSVGNNSSNILANGNGGTGALNLSSLTFDGAATVNLSLGAGVGLNVIGALNTNPAQGMVTINASKTGWTVGSNNLIGFGTFTGSVSDFTLGTLTGLGARQVASPLAISGNNIAIDVTTTPTVWSGAGNGIWKTAADFDNTGTNNFATSTAATNFWAGDTVSFNDTYDLGAGPVTVVNRTIDIQDGNVAAGGLSFNNSAGDYTITSSMGNGITGGTSLIKTGSSSLIIANTNTYTGTTTISGGTLQIGNGVVDGSIANSSGIINDSTLAYNVTAAQTYGNVISGSGNVTKTGTGQLTLTGLNTYAGGTTISGGAVTLNGTGTLGSGAINIASGATLTYDRSAVQNTTVAVSGGGDIVNRNSHSITGDFSGFSGVYTHNSATTSTSFNSANSTSQNASYVVASIQGGAQGLIAAGNGDYTLKMGSLSGVADSLFRGGNSATGITTLEIGNLNSDTTFAGSINSGATKVIALTKVGTGTLTLSGVNAYTGETNVNGGTLAITGSKTGIGSMTVASGATLAVGNTGSIAGSVIANGVLSGTGSLTGTVTVNGTHSVGNSPGLQTIADLAYGGSATFNWELGGNSTAGRGVNFDAVNGTGTLGLNGTATSDLVFNFAGSTVDWNDSFWGSNQSWSVFEGFTTVTGSPFTIGTISADSNSLAFGAGLTAGSSFNWSVGAGNNVLLNYTTAVPEPSTVTLIGLIGICMFVVGRLRSPQRPQSNDVAA